MNNPKVYLPFCVLVLLSIATIALSVDNYSLMIGFLGLVYLSLFGAIVVSCWIYFKYRKMVDGENLYMLTASSILFSFLIILASITVVDKKFASFSCKSASYEVIEYRGRFASGYGKLDKGKMSPNQWILTIIKEDLPMSFVFKQNKFSINNETNEIELQFCRGLLRTEYLQFVE